MPKYNIAIEVGDKEVIERAVKRFETKLEKVKVLKKLRARVHYIKPSIKRRAEKMIAIHRQKFISSN